jgi:hypothetical protein
MIANKRFEKLAKKHGFKIKRVGAMINGLWTRRPDILSVQYQHQPIMVIPKRMYAQPNAKYRDLLGLEQPDFYNREYKLKNWNMIIKRTNYICETLQN